MTKATQFVEDEIANNLVFRVRRADGSQFLTAAYKYIINESGALCIIRRFRVVHPPDTPKAKLAQMGRGVGHSPGWHESVRIIAKGMWVEIEDVTDRIMPVEAKEIENAGSDRGSPEVNEPVAEPPQGVGE